ncbi:ATP-binding protein [Cronbergia sp. UHCC 0137]|uniref:sensor histidine kinase n=1 Tax=Cronbergia sp. UHCC 0137 TaxID=3110239 RepID=UPI002B1EA6EA|nr:ATP-binding protein [Cronbergia sp. UHCC 0137]MEA5620421.1 ATP-binding protein [Cronbergia sp. UHCC 0137]
MLNSSPTENLTEATNQPEDLTTELTNWDSELKFIVEGISSQIGEAFFQSCARYLAKTLRVQYGLIAEFVESNPRKAKVLAFWTGDEFGPNFEYSLIGTPCDVVYEKGIRIYPNCIQKLFPEDQDLVDLQAESYLGIAIVDINGKPLGHIAALHTQELVGNYQEQEAILKIFAARSAAEIERMSADKALKEQNIYLQETLEKLQQTQLELIQAEKMSGLGHLVSGIAHEINNPISFIYGNIQHTQDYIDILLELIVDYQLELPHPSKWLQEKIDRLDLEFIQEDITKILGSMKTGSDRIRNIVSSLRNFSRFDESTRKLVDLHEGIESTLLMLQYRLQADQVFPEIQIIKEYGKIPLINCYASQMNQVFLNILNNAIDALRSESQIISDPIIYITTGIDYEENTMKVSIMDNGIGMSQSTLSRIFDPFFTTKPVGSGTGLGLAISYQIIVEQHDGKLNCVSSPGKFTKFMIEIPV